MTASTNLADVSRFLVGSDTLKLTPFYIKNFSIPGISMSHIAMPTRSGVKLHLGADSMDFDNLDLEVLLDANFNTYFELLNIAMQEVDPEYDSFATPEFNLWCAVQNTKGEELFRFDFVNCRINSIGALSMDPEAELGSTVSVNIAYDYYKWKRTIRQVDDCTDEPPQIKTETIDRYYKHAPNFHPDNK